MTTFGPMSPPRPCKMILRATHSPPSRARTHAGFSRRAGAAHGVWSAKEAHKSVERVVEHRHIVIVGLDQLTYWRVWARCRTVAPHGLEGLHQLSRAEHSTISPDLVGLILRLLLDMRRCSRNYICLCCGYRAVFWRAVQINRLFWLFLFAFSMWCTHASWWECNEANAGDDEIALKAPFNSYIYVFLKSLWDPPKFITWFF